MDLLIIILAVVLALVGLMGGLRLWGKIAESPSFPQIRRCLKIVGLGGASGLFALVIFLFWKMETQPLESFCQYISSINIGSWWVFFYMLGYDTSILRPEPRKIKASSGNKKSTVKCQIKYDLLKKEFWGSIIAIAPAVVLLLFSMISMQVFKMWVASVVGFAMGFFFWEQLKATGILTGSLSRWLVISSILTTVAIGCIVAYGVYISFSAWNPASIEILLVSTILFYECLAWYMLALCVVVFRAK